MKIIVMTDKPLIARKQKPLNGQAVIPGDKSCSHRALMFAALAPQESLITGLLEGEDVLHTARAMGALGAHIQQGNNRTWQVKGTPAGKLKNPEKTLDMGNSGTSTRLLMGLCAGFPITAHFTGDASLTRRPMNRVIKPLSAMGARFEAHEEGRLPLTLIGSDKLTAIEYRLPVASAQVKSAILLAGLNANGTTTVIEDKPTRDHTENMLRHFGVTVNVTDLENGAQAVSINGGQKLTGYKINIPRDPSSAAFPTIAALLTEGSEITLPRIGLNTRRAGLYETLIEMGADIKFENRRDEAGEPVADLVIRGTGPLKGIDVPENRVPSMIDEFPVLAMAAACAEGTTKMTGLAELRVKESDRLLLVAEGLKACGGAVEMGEDSLTIHGNGKPPQGGAKIKTQLDHRIAMSFLVLGGVTAEPVIIDDSAPINTSFPDFVRLMNTLGTVIEDSRNE